MSHRLKILFVAGLALVLATFAQAATIAAGSNVIWGVRADGTVVQWQSNVGSVPAGLSNVNAIGGGNRFALALRSDGTVAAWGQDPFSYGVLSVPVGLSGVVAVEGGEQHAIALTSGGGVVVWGDASNGQAAVPAGLSAIAIGAGDYHNLAVREDGTVAAWGINAFGQTNVPAGLSEVVSVAGGSRHSLALRADGTVAAWGANVFGETTVPAGLSGVTAIAAGWYHNLALRSDGTVVGWGNNDYGQGTIPAGLDDVVAIAAGAYTSMALRADGSLVVWGFDPFGSIEPPPGTTFKVPGGLTPDTTPPALVLPDPITVLATGPAGTVVSYNATAIDDADPAPIVLCTPASGSTFPVGQTTVGCTATDSTGNQSSGGFTVSVTVSSATVTIRAAQLRSAITNLFWTLSGPSTNVVLNGDATRTLVPGTYQISVANAESYGSFTVDAFGQVVNPTGRLTALGTIIDFDLSQLSRVVVAVEHLSSDPSVSLLLGIGVSSLVRGTSPFFYLPPNLPGQFHTVTTRGGDGRFGTFSVNPDLSLGATTGAVIGTMGVSGPQIDFDLSALTSIHLPAAADLWDPDAAATQPFGIQELISSVDNVFATPTIYLPPSSTPSTSYIVRVLTGGRFGTFRIETDGSISAATAGLQFTNLGLRQYQMNFALGGLPSIDFSLGSLSQPFHPVQLALPSTGTVFGDVTLALPPNPTGTTYQVVAAQAVASGPAPSFGTLTVNPDFSLAATGVIRVGADGRTVSVDACQLNGLRISPNPGFRWWLGLSNGNGYTRDNSIDGTPTTIFMPDGTYTIFFQGDGSIMVTVAGGSIISASPGLSVAGGSVATTACDTVAPVLSLPPDFTEPATSAAGAVVNYAATATDDFDPAPDLVCAPPSGSQFSVGTHVVSCTATDAVGNEANGSFQVTVADQTPPVLSLPGPITAQATSPAGALVSFSVTAIDTIDAEPGVVCAPASGSMFPLGATSVSCDATDFSGNVATGTFTVTITVNSANVTIKGTKLRANGASQLLFRVSGPSTSLNQNGDVALILAPGTYAIDAFNTQPYGTFTIDSFGDVVSPTGSLTAAGNIVDFDLSLLAGVAIPVSHLSSNFANGSSTLAIAGISSLVSAANPIYYLPPSLTGASHKVAQRAEQHTFGRFRIKPDLTLEDVDLGDALVLVNDGAGPGGGPRLDFDLSRLYAFTFPYAMTDFGDPATAGRVISVGIGNVAGFSGPATVYLPASGGTTSLERNYVLVIRGGAGVYGAFVIEPDMTPQQATGAVRFDAANNFFLDFNSLAPITLKIRQLAEPFLPLNTPIREAANIGDEITVYLPPSNTNPSTYDMNTAFGTTFGTFTIAPDLSVATTGALRLEADGRTIEFDTCALNSLRIAPGTGRMWRAAISSSGGFYAGFSPVTTTLFLPDGTYGIFFNDGSSISATLAGGVITAANPGMTVSGGSIALGTCDNQPPVLSLPGDMIVAATSAAGAVVNYAVSAMDASDPSPILICAPEAGSLFALGTQTVSCTATDSAGNSASGSFLVTVADQTPPVLTVPADISAIGTTAAGAVVTFSASAVDLFGPVPVVCAPASGSIFAAGTTHVACSASDASGNTASGTFRVFVDLVLTASQDSFLRSGAEDTNEGANTRLRIQNSGNNRVLVRFDLSGLSLPTVVSASLILNIAENSDNWGPTGRLVDAHRLLADWAEGNGFNVEGPNRGAGEGVTWQCGIDANIQNQKPDCTPEWNGGHFASATSAGVTHANDQVGPVSWDVTADVQAGAGFGWLVRKREEGQNGQVRYHSRESASGPTVSPKLVLVFAHQP